MKPELILQSDVLDIVFENKNKEYGAYELRRQYNQRLKKSVVTMAAGVLIFTVLQSWNMKHKNTVSIFQGLDSVKLVEMHIDKVPPLEKKELPKLVHKENVSVAAYNPPLIVPDDKATNLISDIKKIDSSLIGSVEKNGNATTDNIGETTSASNNPDGKGFGTNEAAKAEESAAPLAVAEVMPQFPGGMEAFIKFLKKNLREPSDLEEAQKLVVVAKFEVDAQGNIVDINIAKNGRDDLDAEVLRVIRKMPKWKPGMQNGRNVSVYFNLPVTFVAAD